MRDVRWHRDELLSSDKAKHLGSGSSDNLRGLEVLITEVAGNQKEVVPLSLVS